jgi:hypothetical protein
MSIKSAVFLQTRGGMPFLLGNGWHIDLSRLFVQNAASKGEHGSSQASLMVVGARNHHTATHREIAMEDCSTAMRDFACDFNSVLPETLEEAEKLAASIERAVQHETGYGIDNLTVEVRPEGILLRGRCETYYCKQLAQHAAMGMRGGDRLVNSIEVS